MELTGIETLADGRSNTDKAKNKVIEWQEPEPLTESLKPVEKLPVEIIPKPFRGWVADSAYRMQCPVDFNAAALMVMLGAIIGAGCGVKPKRKDDWLVIPNLWGGVVGRPGTMKTPALAGTLKPLSWLEAAAKESYDDELAWFEGSKEAYKAQKEAIKGKMIQAAKGNKDMSLDELKHEFISLPTPDEPIWRRYKTNDATIEKLSELLKDNPRGILLFRDELVGLLSSWEKEGREPDRAFFLEAWNGQGSITSDRIGRGTVHVENACVSVLGGIQPAKLLAYLYQATSAFENDGLVQRLQFLVYPDELANVKIIDKYPDLFSRDIAFEAIKKLANMDFRKHGAISGEGEPIPYYQFDEQAQDIFYKWLNHLNIKLQADEPPIVLEHLNKYRSLMPSIALIDHLSNIADGGTEGAITANSAALAVAWCEYLESHMRRIYGMVGDITQRAAGELAKKLKAGSLKDGFSIRDVYRQGWHLLATKEAVTAACDELEEAGWLRADIVMYGKTRALYKINPAIFPAKGGTTY